MIRSGWPAQRRVELEAKWELLPRESLEELVGPEMKGVWVPAAQRAKVIQDAAKRREARTAEPAKR